ncbi:MAG TPA: HipA domain-containing protein [Burkholderiaceae bacterium]|nr:HipA domain-containing protein [Burkholderiaceae bacterium]
MRLAVRALAVTLNDRPVGTLRERDDLWSFEYDPAWLAAPEGFDLSPALTRAQRAHHDGGSHRPVQWYFDNLLPEEQLREVVSKEAGLNGDDAFALLEYLGAESAGSLVLRAPGQPAEIPRGLQPLPDAELSRRIRELPRVALSHGAPKRMSSAGAQHKLLVVFRDDRLYEPVGDEPSTHLLKPNHVDDDFPASVINEYIVMRLAARLGLVVPPVWRRYTPEPVYIVERFDRSVAAHGGIQRRHIIDACQLLNKSRQFKYRSATLQTLAELIAHCRNRVNARLRLYLWLVFNVLIANHDNHLKNLSFTVDAEGIALAPAYDLLSTGTYHTRAFAQRRADWPDVEMSIALPHATTFGAVTRESLLQAAEALGLPQRVGARELDRLAAALPGAIDSLVQGIAAENEHAPRDVRPFLAGEMRLLRTLQRLVVPEMLARAALRR